MISFLKGLLEIVGHQMTEMNNIMSMNIQGLGADPKFMALNDFFRSTKSRLLLIQETMHDCTQTISYFRRMFPTWHMVATDAVGLSGGLAVLWDPKWIKAVFQCFAGILILAYFHNCPDPVHILNIYAPHRQRFPFWEKFLASRLFDIDSLMIGGDFNNTLCNDEIWGNGRKVDPIGRMIRNAIIQNNFIDIQPDCRGPTWDNRRSNDSFLAKRLDRYILHGKLIDRFGLPMMKIIPSHISDHRPIYIQWNNDVYKSGYPFKFN